MSERDILDVLRSLLRQAEGSYQSRDGRYRYVTVEITKPDLAVLKEWLAQ